MAREWEGRGEKEKKQEKEDEKEKTGSKRGKIIEGRERESNNLIECSWRDETRVRNRGEC